MSLISLGLIDGYAPVGHDRACAMLNARSQLQCDGEFLIAQPYWRERASPKCSLMEREAMGDFDYNISRVQRFA